MKKKMIKVVPHKKGYLLTIMNDTYKITEKDSLNLSLQLTAASMEKISRRDYKED